MSLSPHLVRYLKGRKEQAMRELLFYEKGYKDDPDKMVARLCEVVFRNAGYHRLADRAREQARKMIDDSTN